MITITVTNKKGGVAKTTTVANLAAEFEANGVRTLAVDLDPQATLTAVAGYDPSELAPEDTVLAGILPERLDGQEVKPLEATWGGDILPAAPALVEVESALSDPSLPGPNRRLSRALERVESRYDVALIDTPPSFGRLVMNALNAADFLVVPLAPDFASIKGLGLLMRTIDLVREYENPSLELLAVFPTQARRTLHAQETMNSLYRQLGSAWLDIPVPQAVAVQDAQASRIPLRAYDPDGKATHAYRRIANELFVRLAARGHDLVEVRKSA